MPNGISQNGTGVRMEFMALYTECVQAVSKYHSGDAIKGGAL